MAANQFHATLCVCLDLITAAQCGTVLKKKYSLIQKNYKRPNEFALMLQMNRMFKEMMSLFDSLQKKKKIQTFHSNRDTAALAKLLPSWYAHHICHIQEHLSK